MLLLLSVFCLSVFAETVPIGDAVWTFDSSSCNSATGSTRTFSVVYSYPSSNNGNKPVTVTTTFSAPGMTVTGTCPDHTLQPGDAPHTCTFSFTTSSTVTVSFGSAGVRVQPNNINNNGGNTIYSGSGSVTYYAQPTVTVSGLVGATCFGGADGSAVITIAGGVGLYSVYLGSTASGTPILTDAFGTHTISGLSAGAQFITIANDMGCSTTSSSFTISQPASAVSVASIIPTPPVCAGGTGSLVATGAGGVGSYEFKLDGGSWTASGSFSGVSSGVVHTVYVRDTPNKCSASQTVTLNAPLDFSVTPTSVPPSCYAAVADGKIDVTITGPRTGAYSIVLSKTGFTSVTQGVTDAGSVTFSNLASGDYTLTVTIDGCKKSVTVVVGESACFCALSQGYWKNHASPCIESGNTPCTNWCGKSFSYYLITAPRGNKVVIAGKQFVAFVLNFWYYNHVGTTGITGVAGTDLRTASIPAGFNSTIADAFYALRSLSALSFESCAADLNLVSNAGLLEGFNSHNTTLYAWNSECVTSIGTRGSLLKQSKRQ